MKNSQFNVFLVFLIAGFGVLGYTSYRTVDFNFATHSVSADQTLSATDVADSVIAQYGQNVEQPLTVTPVAGASTVAVIEPATTPTTTEKPKELTGDRAELATALERLIKDDIRMKIGSSGTRVGTVQKFLNIYEDKKSTVDNKYGEGVKKSIEAFQKAVGDEADGLADPGTYQKMIEWLKANS